MSAKDANSYLWGMGIFALSFGLGSGSGPSIAAGVILLVFAHVYNQRVASKEDGP